MKTVLVVSTLLMLAAGTAMAADSEAQMTPAERAKIVKLLEETRKELLDAVEKLTDEQWNYKPAPERWSVAETAEHILLTERLLFGTVQKALAAPPNPEWKTRTAGKDEFIERVLPDRSRKAEAPAAVRPAGKISREQIIREFKEARERTLQFTRETDRALREHTQEHPFPVFNTLNAYQWLIYIPLHNRRHDLQIAEVKADKGFPK